VSLLSELEIMAYKNLYTRMGVPAHKRHIVIRKLGEILPVYKKYVDAIEKDKYINAGDLLSIDLVNEQLIKQSFSVSYSKEFETAPPAPPAPPPMKIINMAVTIAIAGLAEYAKTQRNFPERKVREHQHKYQMLTRAKKCLEDVGLHDLIWKRPANNLRYNLLVELRQKNVGEEYLLLLNKDILVACYLVPYQENKPIQINGMKLAVSQVKRIRITSTLLLDDEIILFKEKTRSSSDIEFIYACQDETNHLLNNTHCIDNGDKTRGEAILKPKRVTKEQRFVEHFVKGISELQRQDNQHGFISAIKAGNSVSEGGFQQWFKTWFASKYEFVEAESQKGNGRIDLKIVDKKIGTAIIEIKGWWNRDKLTIIKQLNSYLTDFEKSGYILMISHLKSKEIEEEYKSIILSESMGYQDKTWKSISFENTGFVYYISKHKVGTGTKTIYHFFFRVFP
jgi:hypothetical protein